MAWNYNAKTSTDSMDSVGFKLEAMIAGISRMVELQEQSIENAKKLGKETEKADKKTKTLLRSAANLSSSDTWYGKAWVAVRRISSRVAPEFWAIQNAAVGAMDTVESYYKFLDARKKKDSGEKLSPMQKIALGIMDTKKGFEKGMQLERLRLDTGITRDTIKDNEELAEAYFTAQQNVAEKTARGEFALEDMEAMETAKNQLAQAQKIGEAVAVAEAGGMAKYKRQLYRKEQAAKLVEKFTSMKNFFKGLRKFDWKAFGAQIKLIAGAVAKFLLAITLVIVIFKALNLGKLLLAIGKGIYEFGVKVVEGILILIDGFGTLIGGFIDLYNAVDTFMEEGNWQPILDAIIKIVTGAGLILWGLISTLIVPILVGIWEFLSSAFTDWLSSTADDVEGGFNKALSIGLNILTIIGSIAAFIYFLPSVMLGLLAAASVALVGTLIQGFIPGRAMGGPASGLTLVGERGPELVSLPTGSTVYSNSDSKRMATGNTNNITVNVQGRIGASDTELRDIAQKIGRMVNMEVNRTTASRTRGA